MHESPRSKNSRNKKNSDISIVYKIIPQDLHMFDSKYAHILRDKFKFQFQFQLTAW